jgi:hypothetical protein
VTITTMTIVFALAPLEPVLQVYLKALIIGLLLLRILWIFENKIVYHLLAGYELDRTLLLQKSENNLLEMFGSYSKKIYSEPASTSNHSSSISHLAGASDVLAGPGATLVMKGLEKFSRLKDRDEIIAEIKRVKEEKEIRQIELTCLENLLFTVDRESESMNSTSGNRRLSSNGPRASAASAGPPAIADVPMLITGASGEIEKLGGYV